MQSVHSNPPHYSEAVLFGPGVGFAVARLRVDPFTLLLASTNAGDHAALEAKANQGMPLAQAVEAILQERGQA